MPLHKWVGVTRCTTITKEEATHSSIWAKASPGSSSTISNSTTWAVAPSSTSTEAKVVVAITVARVKAIISSGMVVRAKVNIKEAAQVVAIAPMVVAKAADLTAVKAAKAVPVAKAVLVAKAIAAVAVVEATSATHRSNRNMQ